MNSIAIVTGGGGFIGLNLVEELLDRNYEKIIIFDSQSVGFQRRAVNQLKSQDKRVVFVHADIRDQSLSILMKEFPSTDIFHLAAETHVDRSIENPGLFFHTNTIGTYNVCETYRQRRNAGNADRLLVVSTDEVYGDKGPFPTPLGAKIDPSSPYSAGKAGGDLVVLSYRRTYKLPIVLTRCCNNFGKWQFTEKFIPTIIKKVKDGISVPVYGSGQQMRQWVPVREHARRLVSAIDQSNIADADVFDHHIGGFSLTNLELIRTIGEILKKEIQFEHVTDRAGHDFKYELQDEKAVTHGQFHDALTEYIQEEFADGRT